MKCPCCGHQNLPGMDACEQCQTSLTQEDVRHRLTDVERSLMKEQIKSLQPVKPLTVGLQATLKTTIQLMRKNGLNSTGGKNEAIDSYQDSLI